MTRCWHLSLQRVLWRTINCELWISLPTCLIRDNFLSVIWTYTRNFTGPSPQTLCRHCQQVYDPVHYLLNCPTYLNHRRILTSRPPPSSIDHEEINIPTRHHNPTSPERPLQTPTTTINILTLLGKSQSTAQHLLLSTATCIILNFRFFAMHESTATIWLTCF